MSLEPETNTTTPPQEETKKEQPCVTHRVLSPTIVAWMAGFDLFWLDATFKWIFSQQPLAEPLVMIPQILSFQHVENTGVAFGFLNATPFTASLLSGGLWLTLFVLVLREKITTIPQALGFGFVLGGGLNNLLDRVLTGGVTDYIQLTFVDFPIFNVSDVCIFIGSLLLFKHYLWDVKQTPSQEDAPR